MISITMTMDEKRDVRMEVPELGEGCYVNPSFGANFMPD
jgi:hypothetical protein